MLVINRFGTTELSVLKGDSPGHPFRGNQHGAGTGSSGFNPEAEAQAGKALSKIHSDVSSQINSSEHDGHYAETKSRSAHIQVARQIRTAADNLSSTSVKVGSRAPSAKQNLNLARKGLSKLPAGKPKEQLSAALSEASIIIGKL